MASTGFDERKEELETLSAIFQELSTDSSNPYLAFLEIVVAPSEPLSIVCADHDTESINDLKLPTASNKEAEKLTYLPSLRLKANLPDSYPAHDPPQIQLHTSIPWVPAAKLRELEAKSRDIWESYGHVTILYDYISALEEAAQDAFGLGQTLSVPEVVRVKLIEFDQESKQKTFERSSFDCGVCLDPKSGRECYQLGCGDVFCRKCLQEFFTNAIKEGEVGTVACPAFDCNAVTASGNQRAKEPARTIKPSELLRIPLEVDVVRRYVEIKRKKKIESDKDTIYCPRKWCQGFVRSPKYPEINDLDDIIAYDNIERSDGEADDTTNAKSDDDRRLAICEKCKFAFCRTCLRGWHGSFVNCRPRDSSELTEEEQQSYNFIARNTSQCPYCSAPTQKTHGCNHMTCSMCRTHFCYLCQSYLDSSNPYQHFNQEGRPCYQRLWEGEFGDADLAQGNVQFEGARGWELAIAEVDENDAGPGQREAAPT